MGGGHGFFNGPAGGPNTAGSRVTAVNARAEGRKAAFGYFKEAGPSFFRVSDGKEDCFPAFSRFLCFVFKALLSFAGEDTLIP